MKKGAEEVPFQFLCCSLGTKKKYAEILGASKRTLVEKEGEGLDNEPEPGEGDD